MASFTLITENLFNRDRCHTLLLIVGFVERCYDLVSVCWLILEHLILRKRSIVWILCQKYHSDRSACSISYNALATARTKGTDFPGNSNPCHPYDLGSSITNIQSNRMAWGYSPLMFRQYYKGLHWLLLRLLYQSFPSSFCRYKIPG